jgi:small subunit ribosomal protein S16
MLAIRMQRVGRKGFPVYRLAVQEAQRHPSSGRVVAYVGTYNPHTKDASVQVELAQKYLDNGAQPSPRVVKLLKDAGVMLPSWVKQAEQKNKTIRHADKLRKNQPKEEVVEEPAVEAEVAEAEAPAETEAPAEQVEEASEVEDK